MERSYSSELASCFKLLQVQPATATGLVHGVAFVF